MSVTKKEGKTIDFDKKYLIIELQNGEKIYTPLERYAELQKLSVEQLKNCNFAGNRTGVEWKEIGFYLSIESMLDTGNRKDGEIIR
jgi:hypothetical protein